MVVEESAAHGGYQPAVTSAASEDAVKAEFFNEFIPVGHAGYGTSVRTLPTPLVDEWVVDRERAHREASRIEEEFAAAAGEGRTHELLRAAGQTVGGISEVLPAAEIALAGPADR